jgi:DNA-binding NarL/FixJ family response regulator
MMIGQWFGWSHVNVQRHPNHKYHESQQEQPTEVTMNVLIVDDAILVRRSLVKLLDPLKNITSIIEAVSVPEGIRLANENNPEVVILDIRLPGGSGFDVLKHLKALSKSPIVIMLSKYSTRKFRKEALDAGADHFFDKSAEFEKVIDVIANMSENRD